MAQDLSDWKAGAGEGPNRHVAQLIKQLMWAGKATGHFRQDGLTPALDPFANLPQGAEATTNQDGPGQVPYINLTPKFIKNLVGARQEQDKGYDNYALVHELAHSQQDYPSVYANPDTSIREGGAEAFSRKYGAQLYNKLLMHPARPTFTDNPFYNIATNNALKRPSFVETDQFRPDTGAPAPSRR